jgi:hypothetical protein
MRTLLVSVATSVANGLCYGCMADAQAPLLAAQMSEASVQTNEAQGSEILCRGLVLPGCVSLISDTFQTFLLFHSSSPSSLHHQARSFQDRTTTRPDSRRCCLQDSQWTEEFFDTANGRTPEALRTEICYLAADKSNSVPRPRRSGSLACYFIRGSALCGILPT